MVKQSYAVFMAIIVIIGLLALYYRPGGSVLIAELSDREGKVIFTDNLQFSRGAELSQSMFGINQLTPLMLNSAAPLGENPEVVSMRAVVTNPLKVSSFLTSVDVKKNGALLYSEPFSQFLFTSGQEYIYKSQEIEIKGLDAQRNIIDMVFNFNGVDGTQGKQQFQYAYYSLTPCAGDSDCMLPTSICDKENVAGFGKGPVCVKPCTDNSQCYLGQVCKTGRCGY